MLKWGSLPGFWHSQNLSSIIQAQIHLETAALLLTSSILNLFKANTPYQYSLQSLYNFCLFTMTLHEPIPLTLTLTHTAIIDTN